MGQVEGVSWEVLKVEAKVQLERYTLLMLSLSFYLLLTYSTGNLWQRHPQTCHHKASA